MSIFLPDYDRPPPPLLARSHRLKAIFWQEVGARMGGINIAVLVLINISVVVPILFSFYFESAFGVFLPGTAAPLTLFFAPFGAGPWPFFLVLLASSVGAGIIASDVATRSITMYLSRPITAADYLAAKAGAVAFWISLGAIVPGLAATTLVLALGYVGLPLALQAAAGFLGAGILGVAALTGLTVFLSSIASRSTFAGAGIFGGLIGAEAIATVLAGVGQRPAFLYLSPLEDVAAVARALFGVNGNPLDPGYAALLLTGLATVTGALTYSRVRRTEVVSE